MGHFTLNPSTLAMADEDWNFVTVLRNPVSRWISHYLYGRTAGPHDRFGIDEEIGDFVNSNRGRQLGHCYASFFAPDVISATGDIGRAVKACVDRLRRFSVVGRLEDLDDMNERFSRVFGRPLRISKKNVTNYKNAGVRREQVEDHVARITELCQPDIAVYQELFES